MSAGVENQTLVIAIEERFAVDEMDVFRALLNKYGHNSELYSGYQKEYWDKMNDDFNSNKIVVWNHETSELITELNINEEKVLEITGDEFNWNDISINFIEMAGGKLAVNLVMSRYRFLTQIWKLDTEITSLENLSYLTTIDHNLERGCVIGMYMNSNLLCLANRTYREETLILHVCHFDDLSLRTTTVLEDPQRDSHHISIEEGSNEIAVLEKWNNTLKVFKFEAANEPFCLKIDLNYLVKNLMISKMLLSVMMELCLSLDQQ